MANEDRSKPARKDPQPHAALSLRDYGKLSAGPLHTLAFLVPFVAAYELGSALYLRGGGEILLARKVLWAFFEAFGAVGLYLPGLALVTVLITWQVLTGQPWRVRLGVLGGMCMESVAWTFPLLILGVLIQPYAGGEGALAPALAEEPVAGVLRTLPWQARITISIGAGLYEELLFRMVAIAILHMLLVDLAKLKEFTGRTVAIVVSAAIFALFHDVAPIGDTGGGIDPGRFLVFFVPGLYFGALYVMRGFGVVVAVHALYDVLVLTAPAAA